MATGVSSYFDLSGSSGFSLRIEYEQTYDVATNKSKVAITDIYLKSTSYTGVCYYLNGTVKITANDTTTTVITMNSQTPTHKVTPTSKTKWFGIYGNFGSRSNIAHNDDGTQSISISVSVKGYTASGSGSGNGWSVSGSKTIALTTIPRKSTLTASNGTLGTAQTLTISSYSSTFAHSIRYTCGDVDAAICTKISGTSVSFTPSLNLAKQNTTGTSVSITFTLYTFDSAATDATEIGTTTKTITCAIPASVKPSCSVAVTDVLGHIDKYGGYVQGQSDLEIVVTPTLAYESPINTYKVTVDGKTYPYSDVEVSPITGSGNLTVSATVTDKRSRSGTDSETITVLPYTVPTVSKLTTQRCNQDGSTNQMGEYVKVTYSLSITSLSDINTSVITLLYKKVADTDYTSVSLPAVYSAVDATYIFSASIDSSYDVKITATDDFTTGERIATASTAACYMDWDYENDSMAFGKVSEKSKSFECAWTMYDKFDTTICNGLAVYTGGGDDGIDPDTTLEELCLTSHTNAPQGLGTFFYIRTTFYNTKSVTASRSQVAHPYNNASSIYYRYYASGTWSSWERCLRSSDIPDTKLGDVTKWLDLIYPVNSIYISYSHTSPASLFGGTWARIQSRFLWGTTTSGTIGATAGEQTHTLTVDEMPSHRHSSHDRRFTSSTSGPVGMRSATFTDDYTDGVSYTAYTGGGAAHNNMPPYVNIAIWRRTA